MRHRESASALSSPAFTVGEISTYIYFPFEFCISLVSHYIRESTQNYFNFQFFIMYVMGLHSVFFFRHFENIIICLFIFNLIKKWAEGTSLVAQWLGIHLPVQGTWV